MSLLPYILECQTNPSRILNQYFGPILNSEDLLTPRYRDMELAILSSLLRPSMGYVRPWRSTHSQKDAGSTLTVDKDKFQANLDVQQFKPEEITVKATGNNTITIEGKHEEKQDDHGFISRQFMRRYVIPKDCDYNKIESKLSSDGVLTITVPKIKDDNKEVYKTIPIVKTGEPARVVHEKELVQNDKKTDAPIVENAILTKSAQKEEDKQGKGKNDPRLNSSERKSKE